MVASNNYTSPYGMSTISDSVQTTNRVTNVLITYFKPIQCHNSIPFPSTIHITCDLALHIILVFTMLRPIHNLNIQYRHIIQFKTSDILTLIINIQKKM